MEGMSFEEALRQLEDILAMLESGELELEQSLRLFQSGMELSVYCQQMLKQAEGRIQQLTQKPDGEILLLEIDVKESE
ncbi:MAG: exodeoxyribonuclease VII small subunit [Syntrophomonadaceae bacterium]|nr:exodeoxyribonuclease VII small subunit [Syntrophomonadaceae bacterium]